MLDYKKAYEDSKEISALDFDRADTRSQAAIGYGAAEKNEEIVEEGVAIIHQAAKLDVVNPINIYISRRDLMLNQLLTTRKNMTMTDYYRTGCENIEKPADL